MDGSRTGAPSQGEDESLFDRIARVRSEPALHQEDRFTFLNRVDGPYWERLRAQLDTWFGEYPDGDGKADLRGRFRDKSSGNHCGAWWELYLHTLLRRLGHTPILHPAVDGTSSRPDFKIVVDGQTVLIEAAVVFSGIVEEGRDGTKEAWILDAVNRVEDRNFSLSLDFERVGSVQPKVREVTGRIDAWLGSMNPDDAMLEVQRERVFEVRDWSFRITAFPIPAPHRNRPGDRPLGVGPMSAGMVDDQKQLRDTLRDKTGSYGTPGVPLIVAVNCTSSFMSHHDIDRALLGSSALRYYMGREPKPPPRWVREKDGVWIDGSGPRASRLSGVLTAVQLHPWTCVGVQPELWVNPRAAHPTPSWWPFSSTSVNDSGETVRSEVDCDMARVLGLPADWPGPDAPFSD